MSPILLTSTRNPSSRGEKRQNTVSCFCDTALFGSVVSDCLVRFFTFCEISPHFSHFWLDKIYQVLARFNTRLIFMYVSSYFTMVPPCLVSCTSIFSLVGPAWAYCPARPLSPPSLRSLHLSFPLLLPLTWFLTVTSCLARLFRWLLSMFYPNFFPSGASLGHIVRLVPPLSPLLTIFSISSSTSLSSLPSFLFSSLQVFAQSGFAQCGNTLWPKVVFSSHVVRLFALVRPRFAAAFPYAAYADGAAYAAGCLRLPNSMVLLPLDAPLQLPPPVAPVPLSLWLRSSAALHAMVPPTCSWGMPPPCTSHCRLSADGLLASSSFFNKYQPFFHKNPVVSLGILSGSLFGSLLLILLFGSPSPHLLVPLPAHIQAAQGLPNSSPILFLPHFPACLLLDTLLAWYTLFPPLHPWGRGYFPFFLFFRCYPPSYLPPAPSFPTTPLPWSSLYVL